MIAEGITTFLESDLGKMLTGLNKRIARKIEALSMVPQSLENALRVLENPA